MNLRETQELFWRAISWPTGVADFLEQADDDTRRTFEATFAESPAFERNARLTVYAEAYFWRLFEVTADQFDITAWIAGARRFHNFVTDYVLTHPSQNPDIRRFAAGVPQALAEHELGQEIPGIADVAAVQWAIVRAVDGPDEPRMTPDDLAQHPAQAWPQLRLQAVKTAAVVACRADIEALKAAHENEDKPPTALSLPLVDPPQQILVWRHPDLDVYRRVLDPAQTRAVLALIQGETFANVCDAAAGPLADAASPQAVVGWLRRWLADGLIAG